jgi:hypothetical protein
LARKVLEILQICPDTLKKEMISFIPEIVDDSTHTVSI